MSYMALAVKVMIASPGDVAKERQLIRDVIHEWNAIHAEDRKIVLMPVGWERNRRQKWAMDLRRSLISSCRRAVTS